MESPPLNGEVAKYLWPCLGYHSHLSDYTLLRFLMYAKYTHYDNHLKLDVDFYQLNEVQA